MDLKKPIYSKLIRKSLLSKNFDDFLDSIQKETGFNRDLFEGQITKLYKNVFNLYKKDKLRSKYTETNKIKIVGVTSMFDSFDRNILFFDVDGIKKIPKKELGRISNKYKTDFHIFKTSNDGFHIISFDVFDDLFELDKIQKELRTIFPPENKPYSTIIELIVMAALHEGTKIRVSKYDLDGVTKTKIDTKYCWVNNVLRISKKATKPCPKYYTTILSERRSDRICSKVHMDIYHALGLPTKFDTIYKFRMETGSITFTRYLTGNRIEQESTP